MSAPGTDEMPFEFAELFFSRTDPHGIIRAGNSVFQRVAGYSWEELIGKPHKLVRHPDMPRAVFSILWDSIKRGEPVGAYVKNRTKDGRYYWVFAVVTPIEGGYLSVRLKPSSDLFGTARKEYDALRRWELDSDPSPAASAERLSERLAGYGFSNYRAFMAEALAAEVLSRDAQLNRGSDNRIRRFGEVIASAKRLLGHAAEVSANYARNEIVSLNFQVQASKLGEDGKATSQISKNYDLICAQIAASLEKFAASANRVQATVYNGLFLTCTALVQREVLQLFRCEASGDEQSQSDEAPLLEHQMTAYQNLTVEGLQNIVDQAKDFRRRCEDMKRMAGALEVTRIMGMVECARQRSVCESLNELLSELATMQNTVSQGLAEIDRLNQRIHNDTAGLLSHSRWQLAAAR